MLKVSLEQPVIQVPAHGSGAETRIRSARIYRRLETIPGRKRSGKSGLARPAAGGRQAMSGDRRHPVRIRTLLLVALLSPDREVMAGDALGLAAGVELPRLEAKTLTAEAVDLPRDALGRPAILVISFSKAAAKVSRGWLDGCRSAAAGRSPAGVSCYDVRILADVPKILRGMVERGMRNGYPVDLQRQTVLVYSESDAWRERAEGIDDKMTYVIGCDRDGRVRATAAGGFVETERMLEIIEPRPGSP